MNKLVSENPILRFKLGRKVVKMLYGTPGKSSNEKFANWLNSIGPKIFSVKPTGSGLLGWINGTSSNLLNNSPVELKLGLSSTTKSATIGPSPLSNKQKIIKKSGVDKNGNPVRWNEDENGNFISGQYVSDDGNTYWLGSDGSKTLIKRGNPKVVTTNSSNPVTKSLPTRKKIPVTKFKGTVAGGLVLARGNNLSNVISDDLRALLINSGAFNDSDFSNVRAFQNALNRYFAKDGYGSILSDNKWGNQTATAFLEALRKTKSPIVNTLNGVLILNGKSAKDLANDAYFFDVRKPTSPIITQTPTITNLPTKSVRNGNYNKSLIRSLISLGGFDPYKYTGTLRKALRLYLNGESDDTSLLDGTDLARFTLPFRKQGGQLVSRNPIKRFKNKK